MLEDIKKNNEILLLEEKLGVKIENKSYKINDSGEIIYLNLSNNQITNISALASLDKIKKLHLGNNKITDISVLASLDNIIELYLSNNQITNISALASLDKIKKLYLGNNKITDISVLASLDNIIELDLGNNKITDISVLASLDNIIELDLSNNQITNISALASLDNIIELDLSNNQITNISALASLDKIKKLYLGNNKITDVSALASLDKVVALHLKNNPIVNINTLDKIVGLVCGDNKITGISLEDEEGTSKMFPFFRILPEPNKNQFYDTYKEPSEEEKEKETDKEIDIALNIKFLKINLGYNLLALADYEDPSHNGYLRDRIRRVRQNIAEEFGFVLPPINMADDLQLAPDEYKILLKGVEIGGSILRTNMFMALNTVMVTDKVDGLSTKDPAWGLDALWILKNKKTEAIEKGYTILDPSTIIATHVEELIRKYFKELLTI